MSQLPPPSASGRHPVPPPSGVPPSGRKRRATAKAEVPFTVVDTGMVLLLFFVGQLVVGLGYGLIAAVRALVTGSGLDEALLTASDTLLIVAIVAALVGTAMAFGWLAIRRRLDRRLWGPGSHGPLKVVIGLAIGVAATFVTYLINGILAAIFKPEAPVVQQVLQDALAGGRQLVLAGIVIVIVAPITEELIFRGVMLPALQRRVGFWSAAIVSSLVFCAIHVEVIASQPLALVGMFVLSMLLAGSYQLTGSLIVPIIVHAVFNGASLTLALFADRFDEWAQMLDSTVGVLPG